MLWLQATRRLLFNLVGALLAASLLAACTSVKFVPDYDEQIDAGLTQLYADTSAFVDRMVELRGQPAGTLAQNNEFYSESAARVDALIARSEAHRVLDNCPSAKIMNRALAAVRLPAEVRGEIGTLPDGECQVVLLRLVRQGFGRMREIHRIQGDEGFPPAARGQFIEGGVGALLRAAMTVEIAKRAS